jgi:peptidoglycan hydrolase FlgJ
MPIEGISSSRLFSPSGAGQGDGAADEAKLKKACAEFESIFIQLMLKTMRQTVMKANSPDRGSGREMFDPLFDQELSKVFAKGGGIGLGKMIHQDWMKREKTKAAGPAAPPSAGKEKSPDRFDPLK